MRQLRYNAATSLNGFIASPDGSSDWILRDDSIDFQALFAQFDTFVMGRKTYEVLLGLPHQQQKPVGVYPVKDVLVVSDTLNTSADRRVTVVSVSEIVKRVEALKQEDGKDIWLFGGGELARLLLEARLVDTVEIGVMPVLLGSGINLIGGAEQGVWNLELKRMERLGSGILLLNYNIKYE